MLYLIKAEGSLPFNPLFLPGNCSFLIVFPIYLVSTPETSVSIKIQAFGNQTGKTSKPSASYSAISLSRGMSQGKQLLVSEKENKILGNKYGHYFKNVILCKAPCSAFYIQHLSPSLNNSNVVYCIVTCCKCYYLFSFYSERN